jgi:hypothetical protein
MNNDYYLHEKVKQLYYSFIDTLYLIEIVTAAYEVRSPYQLIMLIGINSSTITL